MTALMEAKKAVVVGAGQPPSELMGNGRAISTMLAREGAEVVCVDREGDRAQATVEAIETEGGKAHPVVADTSRPEDCDRLIAESHATLGRIDALVNVVGTSIGDKDPLNLDVETWQKIFDVNLRGTWLVSRAAVPIMQAQGGGAITNISTVGSRAVGGKLFSYSISKAAVNALTHFFAVQYAEDGIRCNVVLPSFIVTPHSMEGLVKGGIVEDEEEAKALGQRSIPLPRVGHANDVAQAVLFLSSDASGYITGLEMPVDGGTLQMIGRYTKSR